MISPQPTEERPLRVLVMAETDHLAEFDAWTEHFIAHVALKGIVATKDDERAARSTTNI